MFFNFSLGSLKKKNLRQNKNKGVLEELKPSLGLETANGLTTETANGVDKIFNKKY